LVARYDANNNGEIEKSEVITAINDYLFGTGDATITKAEVITLINLYLFGSDS
jgi:Ca2+-binding EF-hand superfamily protein